MVPADAIDSRAGVSRRTLNGRNRSRRRRNAGREHRRREEEHMPATTDDDVNGEDEK